MISTVAAWAAPSKPLILILIGAPGSGKNVQSAFLQKEYGLPIVSADQLVKANPQAVASIQTLGTAPIDPRQDMIMNQLVAAKLKTIDTSKGFILDGYPATKAQADFLAGLVQQGHFPPPLILQLDVPDNGRQKTPGAQHQSRRSAPDARSGDRRLSPRNGLHPALLPKRQHQASQRKSKASEGLRGHKGNSEWFIAAPLRGIKGCRNAVPIMNNSTNRRGPIAASGPIPRALT